MNTPWRQWQQRDPQRIALQLEQQTLTWQQVTEQVDQYAAALKLAGLRSGDVLTLVGKNQPSILWWLLAAMQQGVMCAITMPQPAVQLTEKLTRLYGSQPAWLWLSPSLNSLVDELAKCYSSLLQFIDLPPVKPLSSAVSDVDGEAACSAAYALDNLATLIFTSGSMGVPKAVAHTHRQHFASAEGLLARFAFSEQDTWLLSLPLYHVSGLAIVYRWLAVGGCLKLGTGQLLDDIQQVSHASLVVTQLQRLLASQQPLSLSHVLLGGSHIPLTLAQQAAQQGIETWIGYGMTEAASTVTAKPVDETASAGQVLPKRQVKVVDRRIWIAGETLASGYYQHGTITPLTNQQGWFDSGDLGAWYGDELCIIGRADNLFISGGENIHCEEIETVLARHPQIELAVVVPVQDAEFGARSIAVLRCHSLPDQKQLGEWLADKLEKFKHPIAYWQLPDTLAESGIKISRQAVKNWFADQQSRYTPLD
ncbi:o-succinylbenzoate--CoA ligase [Vibrio metschnikovii]|uniref:O-succinylbenzoate--CoA ligase n=1 Tax=bacterium 19MO03SA05 TaxID=2920620 RepID=A0AAU6VB47_UNCXX|nr:MULTISPECIES: o-succinylbenzoate--CoA ligase [unclassified Vibrio]EKO3570945.1 o-succinylbenzoate--CoA ligase [Vibrio metschnikovii]EKO3582089.1 o-succinylbenzoate--CoA ligase [Vibrio metschnikovii]EKO3672006.1 o-succinylbenzoate--CoA ligase [Vibrio metschnikovii]EKO3921879.1 o-succinylbenzoate--CoA ligase [Vibrio metschnikovii]MDQ2106828.1 o-succinylbenzoate--CoA ligase [Vibrio sp. 2017_1457_15]